MMTAAQCLMKASESDHLARRYLDPSLREACIETANGWRRVAVMARQQEAWDAAHPNG